MVLGLLPDQAEGLVRFNVTDSCLDKENSGIKGFIRIVAELVSREKGKHSSRAVIYFDRKSAFRQCLFVCHLVRGLAVLVGCLRALLALYGS